jgi:pimeloyl-ACP methyl ester carboxylesterase
LSHNPLIPIIIIPGGPGLSGHYFESIKNQFEILGFRVSIFELKKEEILQSKESDLLHITTKDLTRFIFEVKKETQQNEVNIIAHSFGTIILGEYLKTDKTYVSKTCLIAPFFDASYESSIIQEFGENKKQSITEDLDIEYNESQLEFFLKKNWKYYFHSEKDQAIKTFNKIIYSDDIFKKFTTSFYEKYDVNGGYAKLLARNLLVINGSNDRLISRSDNQIRLPAYIKHHEIIAQSGHFPFIEKEKEFLDIILPFLALL